MLVSSACRSASLTVRAGARAASSRSATAAAARTKRPITHEAEQADSYQLADKVKQLVLAASRRRPAPGSRPPSNVTQSSAGDSFSPALRLIRTAPSHAATVVVWNVLLNSMLTTATSASSGTPSDDAQAVQRAYQVWMEMKRRGVVPTSRSFGTFLTGVAKRAKRAARAQQSSGRSAAEGWNADLRAKVETVHKQWRTHCERVLERHASSPAALEGKRRGREGRRNAAVAAETEDDSLDGKHDSPESLSAVPTNQYLSFLSASLELCSSLVAPGATPPPAAGPLLSQLVQTFEAMPDPDHSDRNGLARLGRTSVSYAIVWGALKSALRMVDAAAAAAAPVSTESEATGQQRQRGREIEDGLELLTVGEPASSAATTEALPTTQQILDKALAMWDHLVVHPPTPELPSSSSPNLPSSADSLSPILPTALISLYLSISLSASASIPPATHARFLSLPQLAFGFVPPSRIAELEPPHPPSLVEPLCGSGSGGDAMDHAAFGASLRLAMRAAPSAGVSEGAKWTRSWWDQVRDYPERFGLARGLGLDGEGDRSSGGGVLGEEVLRDREAAEVVIKASGRAGDIEAIEDLFSYLKSTVATHPFSCSRSHAPLVSTYTLALSSLSRIGTQAALTSAIRIWNDLLVTEPPFVPSPARSRPAGSSEKVGVPKAAYAKGAYELVRMAVMGVRERTAVWAAVKAVSGLEASRASSASSSSSTSTASGATAADAGSAAPIVRGAFHPLNFPPRAVDGDSAPRRSGGGDSKRDAELDQLARILHNALGRILSGDGRPGDLSSQLGSETVKVLEEWRGRIKAYAGIGDRAGGGADRGAETMTDAADGEMAWRRRETVKKQAERERTLAYNGADRRPPSPARSYSRDRDDYRQRRREEGDRRYSPAGRPGYYEDRPPRSRPSYSSSSLSRASSRSQEDRSYRRY